ncbi:MAG: lysylphosphatidylglycerol synthase transmembrane domain-containing protein [Proteobacteria bacterium]|nr:lysylphosphatidylglycerol synthase transmembrane domain-containing protein [Pseudomonadota bacterium]
MARTRASRLFDLGVLAVAAVALGFVVNALGWDGLRRSVLGTGAWFAVLAVIDLASAACDAFAMHGLAADPSLRLRRVLAAQLSGIAINRMTPANSLGEAVKIRLLARDLPLTTAASTVVMFNLSTIFLGILAVVVGVPLTVLLVDLPASVALALWIGMGILLGFAIVVAILVQRGAVGSLIDALEVPHLISAARAARWRAGIIDVDDRLRALGHAGPGVARGFVGVLGSRVLNWLGTIVVLHAVDISLSPPLVFAALSVGILITWMSNVVPLGLGLADGTNYVLYGVLGASSQAGLLFTMVNRLRTIVLATIGLVVMTILVNRRSRSDTT